MKIFKNFKPRGANLSEIKTESNMILDVRERPHLKSWIMLSIQHVFAMFGATVLIPLLMGLDDAGNQVISTDVALFASGIGTLIYILVTRARVPIYLGSSAAYIASVVSLYPTYGTSTFFGFIGVGVVYALVSLAIYLFGTKWIKKMLPPVVVGPMIMVIGLGLAGIAINSIGITDIQNMDWMSLLIAIVTVASAMLIALLFRGKMKLVPILGALLVGFVFALIISSFYNHHFDSNAKAWTKLIDYDRIDWSRWETYINAPHFEHTPFHNMQSSKWSFMPFLLMMPVAFATIAEHIGDHTVLGRITGRDYINGTPGVHKTILGDGLATMFAGFIGGPANTSYGENTTTVGLSKVGSVYVTGLAAIFAVLMSFIQLIPSILGMIPQPVLGGLEIILFGFIASNGLKVIVAENVNFNNVRNVFIVSVMLVIGLGGAVIGGTIGSTIISFAGTSLSMIFGITLSLTLPEDRGIDHTKMPKAK